MSSRLPLALLALLLACAPAAARAGWLDSDWKQRQLIRVGNDTDSGLANYQTRIVVAHRPGMQPDFSDARFTDANGVALAHWLESFAPSETAVFWVKVSHLPARSEQTVHLYFDNPAAQSTSSGAAVFDFFDDFSSPVSLEEWATNGAGMRLSSGGLLSVGTTGANYVYTKNFSTTNGVVEARLKAARNHNANVAGRINLDAKLAILAGNAGYFGKLFLIEYQPALKSFGSDSFAQSAGFNTFSLRLQHTTAGAQAETGQAQTPRLEGATGAPRSGAVGFYLKNSDAQVDWFRVRQYAPAEPLTAAGELQSYDGVVNLTRFEKLGCLSASDIAQLKADPSKSLDVFEKCKGELAFKIGFNLSKAELYAAFCTVVSYLTAPYGRSYATQFADLLDEPALACDNYALLVGHFNELYCDPATLQFVGMDGGAIGNHAQVFVNDRVLLDPTIGLVALASRDDVFGGRPVTKIVHFNLRSELATFRRTVVGALNAGAYRPSDIIYSYEDFRGMKDRYGLARGLDGPPLALPLRTLPGPAHSAGF